jgi:hypothetical protein
MPNGMDADTGCSTAIPLIQAAGYTYVGRYYSSPHTSVPQKVLQPSEASLLSAAGLKLFAVWEFRKDPGYFTHDQGVSDATTAYKYANEIIHQPFGSAIYFAVDFDATQKQYTQEIAPYFQGVNDAFAQTPQGQRYDIGVYGSGAICGSLHTANLAKYQWLSCSPGWRGTPGYNAADIYQQIPIHPPAWPFGFEPDTAPQWGFGEFQV